MVGTRGCRCDSSSIKENAKPAPDISIDKTGYTKFEATSFPISLTATRDTNVSMHAVQHHFPSVLSFEENLPLVGSVSHIATPESTNGLSKSSCEESSTSKALSDVHISERLMEEFMELASANTKNNLETCGILGAYLKNQTFYVTTLIIPKQEATSNSCQALNEEEIHAVQDGQSLFPVGWIHTHPSQTCFLSSIDLHTQYSYQELWNIPADRPRRDHSPQRVPREWGIPHPPGNLFRWRSHLRELLQCLHKSKFEVRNYRSTICFLSLN